MEDDDEMDNRPLLKMKRANVKLYDGDEFNYNAYNMTSSSNEVLNKKISYINEMDLNNYKTTHDEIHINLEDSQDEVEIKAKVEEIKNLKKKKQLIEVHEEKYDQDYVEIKNMNGSDLIKGNNRIIKLDVYQSFEKNDVFNLKKLDDQSDSEKELLQWEFEKLKNGMSANCKDKHLL